MAEIVDTLGNAIPGARVVNYELEWDRPRRRTTDPLAALKRVVVDLPPPPPPQPAPELPPSGQVLFDFPRFRSLEEFGDVYKPEGGAVRITDGDLVCWAPGKTGDATPKALVQMYRAVPVGKTILFVAEITVYEGNVGTKWWTLFDAERKGDPQPGTRVYVDDGKIGVQQKFDPRSKLLGTASLIKRNERFRLAVAMPCSRERIETVVSINGQTAVVFLGATCLDGEGWGVFQFGLTANGDAGALGLRVHNARLSLV